jgi:hypothetical protein
MQGYQEQIVKKWLLSVQRCNPEMCFEGLSKRKMVGDVKIRLKMLHLTD